MNRGIATAENKGWKSYGIIRARRPASQLQADKTMDVFGGCGDTMKERLKVCKQNRKAEDTLVLTGDHSGKKTGRMREDLAFIENLPGRKILLRGNHDMFWDAKKTKL